ncbi:hypothetical protein CIK94_05110 [Prevotella sp. P4-51]|nr:BACON domain-containing carbohydrate-binding protein [Prevotella sp. P5-64]OYP70211.1 hypothetical protein CIK87_03505 [Prevotella sp. P5-64]OYP76091.1 hypothetical protein CIK94_05110 [Prevotella sp. P4-51]
MKKFMNYLRVAVVALTISMAMSGCSSSDDPAPAPTYNVSLVNESDAALDVDPAALSEQIIKIQTDAPLTDLSIQKVTEQSWCIATVKSTSEIAVTAGANTSTADRVAKFKLLAGSSVLEFSVTQAGANPQNVTLSIESEQLQEYSGMYSYMGQNDKAVVKVKVTTNASRWHATATAMMGNDADFVITKARGKSGEEMEFYLQPSMSEMLAGTITITAGDQSVDITVNQMTMNGATMFKLFSDENKTKAFANKTTLNFAATFDKDDTTEHIKTFYVTTDGGYVTLVCKAGTDTEVEGDAAWLTAGGNLDALRISATSNTTGAERKLDVVIVDSDNWSELFRIPVVQAAK